MRFGFLIRILNRLLLLAGCCLLSIGVSEAEWGMCRGVGTLEPGTDISLRLEFGLFEAKICGMQSSTVNGTISFPEECQTVPVERIAPRVGQGNIWTILARLPPIIQIPKDIGVWQDHAIAVLVVAWFTSLMLALDLRNKRSSEAWNAATISLLTLFGILCAQVIRIYRVSFALVPDAPASPATMTWSIYDGDSRRMYLIGGGLVAAGMGLTVAWDRWVQPSYRQL